VKAERKKKAKPVKVKRSIKDMVSKLPTKEEIEELKWKTECKWSWEQVANFKVLAESCEKLEIKYDGKYMDKIDIFQLDQLSSDDISD
jgi:hypothetical protein